MVIFWDKEKRERKLPILHLLKRNEKINNMENTKTFEQLKADKEELLQSLEEINILLNNIYLTDNRLTLVYNKNRSLIQKHKP